MNGDVTENGVPSDGETPPTTPNKCDVIVIMGRKENCKAAHDALQVCLHR